jgi:hypothetical protein
MYVHHNCYDWQALTNFTAGKPTTTGATDGAAEAAEAEPTVEEAAENDEFLRRFIDRPEDELEKDLDAALNQNAVVAEVSGKEKKFDPLANPFDASTPILTSPKPMHAKERKVSVPLVTEKNPFAWVTVDNPMIPETIKKTKLYRRSTLLVCEEDQCQIANQLTYRYHHR